MNPGVRIVTLGAAWMLSSVAPAGMNSWTAIGPSGGQVNKIAFNPNSSNIVYALSAGGSQRSTDGGVRRMSRTRTRQTIP